MSAPSNIVFVCAGNICRSPLAEHFFRRAVDEGRAAPLPTSSMGLIAEHDDRAIVETLLAARRAGLDLDAHRARRFDAAAVPEGAWLFVMEPSQREAVLAATGFAPDRVRMLGDLAPGPSTIADPENGTEAIFDACVARIGECVDALVREVPARA